MFEIASGQRRETNLHLLELSSRNWQKIVSAPETDEVPFAQWRGAYAAAGSKRVGKCPLMTETDPSELVTSSMDQLIDAVIPRIADHLEVVFHELARDYTYSKDLTGFQGNGSYENYDRSLGQALLC